MEKLRPTVVAQPRATNDWEVLSGNWDRDGQGTVIGFIVEFGGVYEVETLTGARTREYCASFKEAMECFEMEGGRS